MIYSRLFNKFILSPMLNSIRSLRIFMSDVNLLIGALKGLFLGYNRLLKEETIP